MENEKDYGAVKWNISYDYQKEFLLKMIIMASEANIKGEMVTRARALFSLKHGIMCKVKNQDGDRINVLGQLIKKKTAQLIRMSGSDSRVGQNARINLSLEISDLCDEFHEALTLIMEKNKMLMPEGEGIGEAIFKD